MKEDGLMSYFRQQMRDLLGERQNEASESWDVLAKRELSDDEVLRLLSISTASDQWPQVGFAFPFEALDSLPKGERALICQEFRKLLKSTGQYQ